MNVNSDSILHVLTEEHSKLPPFFNEWNKHSIKSINTIYNSTPDSNNYIREVLKLSSSRFETYAVRKSILTNDIKKISSKLNFDYETRDFIVLENILNFDHFGTTLYLLIEMEEGYVGVDYGLYDAEGSWSKLKKYKKDIKNELRNFAKDIKLNGKLMDFYMLSIIENGKISCHPLIFLDEKDKEDLNGIFSSCLK